MKIKLPAVLLYFYIIIFLSCVGNKKNLILTPDTNANIRQEILISVDNIIETKNGLGNENLPDWLATYIDGGIREVENMRLYAGKYCFIGRSESGNFEALNKWTDNYSVIHDFSRLAAVRIENRLVSAAALYPDDEYGIFFEKMVKKAFDAEYPGVLVHDTFWIKKTVGDASGFENSWDFVYESFMFISIDKSAMQTAVNKMITEVRAAVSPTRAQNTAINRLQQTFFEGF